MTIESILNSVLNPVLGPVMSIGEPYALMAISFLITLITTVIYKYTTDQEFMKSVKEEMNVLKEDAKKFKDDPKKMMEVNKVMWEKSMKQMSQSFKPMLYTFIPIIFLFGWLRNYYNALALTTGNTAIFFSLSWLWSYIIFSLVFNLALRKVLKIH